MHVVLRTPVGISEKAVKIWNHRYYGIGRSIRSGSTENGEQSTEYMRGIMLRDQVSVGPDLTLLRVIPYACWLCLSTGGAARTAPARPGQRRKLFEKLCRLITMLVGGRWNRVVYVARYCWTKRMDGIKKEKRFLVLCTHWHCTETAS